MRKFLDFIKDPFRKRENERLVNCLKQLEAMVEKANQPAKFLAETSSVTTLKASLILKEEEPSEEEKDMIIHELSKTFEEFIREKGAIVQTNNVLKLRAFVATPRFDIDGSDLHQGI